jgi:ribose 5-phosphate isomerase B
MLGFPLISERRFGHPLTCNVGGVRIAVSSDSLDGVAELLVDELEARGHTVFRFGAYADDERTDWAWSSEAAARAVVEHDVDQAVVCCWTGTGASIAANKVAGARAALCGDAETADGARKWNDANVLALSLRLLDDQTLGLILDAWFAGSPSEDPDDRANIAHIAEIE